MATATPTPHWHIKLNICGLESDEETKSICTGTGDAGNIKLFDEDHEPYNLGIHYKDTGENSLKDTTARAAFSIHIRHGPSSIYDDCTFEELRVHPPGNHIFARLHYRLQKHEHKIILNVVIDVDYSECGHPCLVIEGLEIITPD